MVEVTTSTRKCDSGSLTPHTVDTDEVARIAIVNREKAHFLVCHTSYWEQASKLSGCVIVGVRYSDVYLVLNHNPVNL